MQLCVNNRIPKNYGGVDGQTLYIDSEGSFTPERVYDMAKALVKHVQNSAIKLNKQKYLPSNWTPESILDSIQIFRVHDETSQTATIYNLSTYIQQNLQQQPQKPIKLIVIDSIAFHYRAITPNSGDSKSYYVQRTQQLAHLASFLGDIAQTYQIAIVVLNQMTTKIFHHNNNNKSGQSSSNTSSRLVPALGESWAHATTTRILLSENTSTSQSSSSIKTFTLVKSPHLPQGKVQFQILSVGIRDPTINTNNKNNMMQKSITATATGKTPQQQQQQYENDENQNNKRIRRY